MIEIKIHSKETLDDFTKDFVNEDKLDTGSLNAMTAACAAALFCRAAARAPQSERQEYMVRNGEILRSYFIHMVDDDVKCRRDYVRLKKNGEEQIKIEAAMHPACTINEEIVSMCSQMLELGLELKEMLPEEERHVLREMAELAYGAVKSSIAWLLNLTSQTSDETYKYVVRRENELNLETIKAYYDQY